jgi:hypothetical protein
MGTNMPKYFFDIENGHGPSRDEDGLVLASEAQIMRETSRILLDIARNELPGQDNGEISIRVRDDHGEEICATHLSFRTEWKGRP